MEDENSEDKTICDLRGFIRGMKGSCKVVCEIGGVQHDIAAIRAEHRTTGDKLVLEIEG